MLIGRYSFLEHKNASVSKKANNAVSLFKQFLLFVILLINFLNEVWSEFMQTWSVGSGSIASACETKATWNEMVNNVPMFGFGFDGNRKIKAKKKPGLQNIYVSCRFFLQRVQIPVFFNMHEIDFAQNFFVRC